MSTPGQHGPEGRLVAGEVVDDPPHLQGVGHDQAVETHLPAQQARQDRGRQRGRQPRRRIQGRHGEMGDHHGHHPGFDGPAKGGELDPLQPLAVGRDDREDAVRIQVRVAVAGEVLGRGDQAVVLAARG
jgi:hypothetical protein